jgi:hypothetical protein
MRKARQYGQSIYYCTPQNIVLWYGKYDIPFIKDIRHPRVLVIPNGIHFTVPLVVVARIILTIAVFTTQRAAGAIHFRVGNLIVIGVGIVLGPSTVGHYYN